MKRRTVTANVTGAWRMENGAMVAPATLMTAGVRCGSHGCLLWEESVIRASARQFEGVPVTLNHPNVNGQFVSIDHSAAVRERYEIGRLRNARYQGGLRADLVITKNDAHVRSLVQGRREVSVGVFTDEEPTCGRLGDRTFEGKVTGVRAADHVAILSEAQGACSWEDGCGIRANRNPEVFRRALQTIIQERRNSMNESEILLPPEVETQDGGQTDLQALQAEADKNDLLLPVQYNVEPKAKPQESQDEELLLPIGF